MTNDYAPEVIRGAKRLQRAYYKRRLGPWENVIPHWSFLTDSQRDEFLKMAALFYAAEYLHDGNADAVVADVANELRRDMPNISADMVTAYVANRYANYTNPDLDKD